MTFHSNIVKNLLLKLPADRAHDIAIKMIKYSPEFLLKNKNIPEIPTEILGIKFKNPLGLAAGFDKNAEAILGLSNMGFGFLELGTVTPKPQFGNKKPRIFRDKNTLSIINKMGFPSVGLKEFKKNLIKNKTSNIVLGINIGKNKNTSGADNIYADYQICMDELSDFADYFVLNISSPNTPNLRDLQNYEALNDFLKVIDKKRSQNIPLFVKIAPDLNNNEINKMAEVIMNNGCDGVIISNTTVSRPNILKADFAKKQGGLSGALLRDNSTEMIAKFYKITEGKLPIIGVGGIFSGKDMFQKICAGASLVQIYTSFIFGGAEIIEEILLEFLDILQENNVKDYRNIIGIDNR